MRARRAALVVLVAGLLSFPAAAMGSEPAPTEVTAHLSYAYRCVEMSTPAHSHRVLAIGGASAGVRQRLVDFSNFEGRLSARLRGAFHIGQTPGDPFAVDERLGVQRWHGEGLLAVERPLSDWLRVGVAAGVGMESVTVQRNTIYTGQQYVTVPVEVSATLEPGLPVTLEVGVALLPVVHYVQSAESPTAQVFGSRGELAVVWPISERWQLRGQYDYRRFRSYLPLASGENSVVEDDQHTLGVGIGGRFGR